jgi:hypothetical protein
MNISRKPKSWFETELAKLNNRLKVLTHFKMKAEQSNDKNKSVSIDAEISQVKTNISRNRLDSNFAALEE